MADRVHPAVKPAAANGGATSKSPASKAQLYNTTRPIYRPRPPPPRGYRRSCCCSICLWMSLLILLLLTIIAGAAAVFYFLYRPHPPAFSVASLHLSRFNLTDTAVTSAFTAALIARNPNSGFTFFYDRASVRILSGGVDVGDGSFAAFAQAGNNVTSLKSAISSSNASVFGDADPSELRSSVKSGNLRLEIQLDTDLQVKFWKVETKKVGIRVSCDGIRVAIPRGKTASVARISKAGCRVEPRIKILRWTV